MSAKGNANKVKPRVREEAFYVGSTRYFVHVKFLSRETYPTDAQMATVNKYWTCAQCSETPKHWYM